MKYVDEFRDPAVGRALAQRIHDRLGDRPATLMEVCGTHTVAVFRAGIRDLLPPNLKLLSGPGCPVCVTPNSYVDHAIALARRPDVIVVTFGDMIRVPGSTSTLERERAAGAEVRVAYSPLEALALAEQHPDRKVVFLAVGFETTAPTLAAAVAAADKRDLRNFFLLAGNKTMPKPMAALAADGDLSLDGVICPGHVSVITGAQIYQFLAQDHGLPCVVAGFEPLDVLQGIAMLVDQVVAGKALVEIQYTRAVTWEGNVVAQQLLDRVFVPSDAEWRGLGVIPGSGLALAPAFERFDAAAQLPVEVEPWREHAGCLCGQVLKGTHVPADCRLFRTVCTPETPLGPCMVSSEGTCATYYRYAAP